MKAAIDKRRAEIRAKLIATFDINGDKKLSEAERATARAAYLRKQWANLPDPAKKRILSKFDVDKDGKLSEAEKKAAWEAAKKRMEEARKGKGGGPRHGPKRGGPKHGGGPKRGGGGPKGGKQRR